MKYLTTGLLAIACLIAQAQTEIELKDDNWQLWVDTAAQWENDELYLPGEFGISDLPVNPPTGGWQQLSDENGLDISLPTTVEEHYWGHFGFYPYKGGYKYEDIDTQVVCGAYRGVSWWWTDVYLPEAMEDKNVLLHLRAMRHRAEVYVNGQLCGYHLIAGTSYKCDISGAIRPGGTNRVAIRITNPGGNYDWRDNGILKWGEYEFQNSHGFGGLDRGLRITAHDEIYMDDCWALNTPQEGTLDVYAKVANSTGDESPALLLLSLTDPDNDDAVVAKSELDVNIKAEGLTKVKSTVYLAGAELWSPENPKLYDLHVELISDEGETRDKQVIRTGFRWLEADGVGENAVLRLNGKRIRLTSAISWGFWGYNGLYPRLDLAEKEVRAAKTFGMNCIQFHRNIGRTDVLDIQDELGLMRYMEPGGGRLVLGNKYPIVAGSPDFEVDPSGKGGEPGSFLEKYMEEKIIGMIRDHRSHPSLVIYNLQNEMSPSLKNPRIFHIIRRMMAEDPSRNIVLKSGIKVVNQVWARPYDDRLYYDDGTGYSGWWDKHTVGGPGVWMDYWNSVGYNAHQSDNWKEIVTWGEMLGAAVPDNHELMVSQLEENDGNSYDYKDHVEILDGYNQFLDHWGFRSAFPTASDLYYDIGNKCYDFWGRVMENARLSEPNDFLVISGWESTSIENHSGMLDNLRNFKGDPQLLARRMAPMKPAMRFQRLVYRKGEQAWLDLFLLNESHREHSGHMSVWLIGPDGVRTELITRDIPLYKKDQFVYPVYDSLSTPALDQTGWYQVYAQLDKEPEISFTEKILVLDNSPSEKEQKSIAVLSPDSERDIDLIKKHYPNCETEAYNPDKDYDLLVMGEGFCFGYPMDRYRGTHIKNSKDSTLHQYYAVGDDDEFCTHFRFKNLKGGTAKIQLFFSEIRYKKEGERVFDLIINDRVVLEDLDIFKTAGGHAIVWDTTLSIAIPDGELDIRFPPKGIWYAKIDAFRIDAGGETIAINAGGPRYTDSDGLVWDEYREDVKLNAEVLAKVDEGMGLLLFPQTVEVSDRYAQILDSNHVLDYHGVLDPSWASWMGSWYFVRRHPVYKDLPADCAMKSYYQVPVTKAHGLLVDGQDMEVFAAYSKDHNRQVGAASFSLAHGQGRILVHTLPGLLPGANGKGSMMNPVVAEKLFANSIAYLLGKDENE